MAPRFSLVTLGLGAWPGRFRCGSSKTQSHFVGLGLLLSLRSKLPYALALALLAKKAPHLRRFFVLSV